VLHFQLKLRWGSSPVPSPVYFFAVLGRIKIDGTPIALQVLLHPYSKGWISHKTEKKKQLLSVPLYAVILFTLCKKHIKRYHGLPLERLLD